MNGALSAREVRGSRNARRQSADSPVIIDMRLHAKGQMRLPMYSYTVERTPRYFPTTCADLRRWSLRL